MTQPLTSSQNASNRPVATAGYVGNSLPKKNEPTQESVIFTKIKAKASLFCENLSAFNWQGAALAVGGEAIGGACIFGMVKSCILLGGVPGAILGLLLGLSGFNLCKKSSQTFIAIFQNSDDTDLREKVQTTCDELRQQRTMLLPLILTREVVFPVACSVACLMISGGAVSGVLLGVTLIVVPLMLDFITAIIYAT